MALAGRSIRTNLTSGPQCNAVALGLSCQVFPDGALTQRLLTPRGATQEQGGEG